MVKTAVLLTALPRHLISRNLISGHLLATLPAVLSTFLLATMPVMPLILFLL